MDDKEKLISLLKERVGFVLADVSTFQFVRQEGVAKDKPALGGGNLLSLTGIFSAINLLSKAHWILKGLTCVADEDVTEFDELNDKLEKADIYAKFPNLKKYLRRPRRGDINESDAFCRLVNDVPIDFGIEKNNNDLVKVWRIYRNGLSHLAIPYKESGSRAVHLHDQHGRSYSVEEYQEAVRQDDTYKSFEARGNGYVCNYDYLRKDLEKILEYIIAEVNSAEVQKELVGELLNWLYKLES